VLALQRRTCKNEVLDREKQVYALCFADLQRQLDGYRGREYEVPVPGDEGPESSSGDSSSDYHGGGDGNSSSDDGSSKGGGRDSPPSSDDGGDGDSGGGFGSAGSHMSSSHNGPIHAHGDNINPRNSNDEDRASEAFRTARSRSRHETDFGSNSENDSIATVRSHASSFKGRNLKHDITNIGSPEVGPALKQEKGSTTTLPSVKIEPRNDVESLRAGASEHSKRREKKLTGYCTQRSLIHSQIF
jgi:hypothetical protein